jgi:hypothetical protein
LGKLPTVRMLVVIRGDRRYAIAKTDQLEQTGRALVACEEETPPAGEFANTAPCRWRAPFTSHNPAPCRFQPSTSGCVPSARCLASYASIPAPSCKLSITTHGAADACGIGRVDSVTCTGPPARGASNRPPESENVHASGSAMRRARCVPCQFCSYGNSLRITAHIAACASALAQALGAKYPRD